MAPNETIPYPQGLIMFAILITEENMPKIREVLASSDRPEHTIEMYIRNHADWYFIRGYVPHRGVPQDFTVLPAYILRDNFECNFEKAKTDWDQIVRKESD